MSFRKPAASQSRAALSKDTKEMQFKFHPFSIHGTISLSKLADIRFRFQLWRRIAQAGHPESLKFEFQTSMNSKFSLILNICMHTYIHTCIHAYIHTYVHAYICMHACIHTYIRACSHTYMHAYIHTCIHTNTHI